MSAVIVSLDQRRMQNKSLYLQLVRKGVLRSEAARAAKESRKPPKDRA